MNRYACETVADNGGCGQCLPGYTGDMVATTTLCAVPTSGTVALSAVEASMSLNMSCVGVVSDPAPFIETFKEEMVTAISDMADRLEVTSVACGSVIVEFTIIPSPKVSAPSSSALFNELYMQILTPSSAVHESTLLSLIPNVSAISATSAVYQLCSDGQVVAADEPCVTSTESSSSSTLSLPMLVGVAVGGGALVIAFAVYFVWRRRRHRRRSMTSTDTSDTTNQTSTAKEEVFPTGEEVQDMLSSPRFMIPTSGATSRTSDVTVGSARSIFSLKLKKGDNKGAGQRRDSASLQSIELVIPPSSSLHHIPSEGSLPTSTSVRKY